jgi:hypothetical protein
MYRCIFLLRLRGNIIRICLCVVVEWHAEMSKVKEVDCNGPGEWIVAYMGTPSLRHTKEPPDIIVEPGVRCSLSPEYAEK